MPMSLLQSRYLPLLVLILLLCASASLYIPWIDNPLVFDDLNLLKSPSLGDYAVMPFSLQPRQFPYFTLGFEQVISSGNLHVSRYVALILHGLNGFLLFLLSRRLLGRVTTNTNKATVLAFAAGLLFVVHPVSVYAVGYLIQRTILFATFFLLLSAIQFDKALSEGSLRRAIFAGLCYGMSTMSKEHAVTGILSILLMSFLQYPKHKGQRLRICLFFGFTGGLIASLVVLQKLGYLGVMYEPDANAIISNYNLPIDESPICRWATSAALQCLFFFRYLYYWLWPAPIHLSIDIRPDIANLVTSPSIYAGVLGFLAIAGLTAVLIKRSWLENRPSNPIGIIILMVIFLYLVELSSVRFQEPFVLYRSYLWGPFFILLFLAFVLQISFRLALLVVAIGLLAFPPIATSQLASFSNELVLWQGALQKAGSATAIGMDRIHYNIGQQLRRQRNWNGALAEFDWVVQHSPNHPGGYLGRSEIRFTSGDLVGAKSDTQKALELKPDLGIAYFRLGLICQALGETKASEQAFSSAEKLGYGVLVALAKTHSERKN